MDILNLASEKSQLKKTASTHGGEWTGPCPSCGGRDRFHVWPNKSDSKRADRIGVYWCRSCGKSGDAVQFMVDFDGKSYAEALAALGLESPAATPYRQPSVPGSRRTSSNQKVAPAVLKNSDSQKTNPGIWQSKAQALVAHAAGELSGNEFILEWLKKRGISSRQAETLRLGWLSEDRWRPRDLWGLDAVKKEDGTDKKLWIPAGLVIPMLSGESIRRIRIRRFTDQEPRYYVLPGSDMCCMAYGLPQRAAAVVESELDAIMLAGQVGEFCGVIAMGSSTAKPDAVLDGMLRRCAVILVALDCDPAGAKACAWWMTQYPQAKRWPVPVAKDPGDAYAAGVSMESWIKAGLPSAWFLGPAPIGQIVVEGTGEKKAMDGKAATTEGESAHIADEQAVREQGGQTGAAAPTISPLDELAGLLRKHPVKIRIRQDQVTIIENEAWVRRNWETSRRISSLVYMDEVLDHLWALGVEVINGSNIISR